jgi:hypothetical protein
MRGLDLPQKTPEIHDSETRRTSDEHCPSDIKENTQKSAMSQQTRQNKQPPAHTQVLNM